MRAVMLLMALAATACAPALTKLPRGSGTPVDARDALQEATASCINLRSYSAEMGVSGSVGGQTLRGRLLIGVASPDSARIEAVAPFGPPVFIFVAHHRDATLLLPRDERVLEHGKPADVLDAVAGLPLDAPDLRRALTGCPNTPNAGMAAALGDDWRMVADPPDAVYLHREQKNGPWRIVAVLHAPPDGPPWRADYKQFAGGLPRSVRLSSADMKRFDLRLSLSQVDINPQLGDEAFRVQVPRSADPISLDELRRARPGVRQD